MKGKRGSGEKGENYALKLLLDNGYKILDKNFRSKIGEIDIVAQDGDVLVFVEVKTRWSKKFGLPEEAVTPRKIARIKKTAYLYLRTHQNLPKSLRIDVVAIQIQKNSLVSAKIIKVE